MEITTISLIYNDIPVIKMESPTLPSQDLVSSLNSTYIENLIPESEIIPLEVQEATSAIITNPSFDWNKVPDYLRKYVAVFLRYSDILALCDSSKSVREEICEDDFFWKMKTKHDFGVEYDIPPWPRESWEEDYRYWMVDLRKSLSRAIITRNSDQLRNLIDFGVDVNGKYYWSWTPLMIAVETGDMENVKLLLEAGAYVNARRTAIRDTVLHIAVFYGRIDIVQVLLDYGIDVTAKDKHGMEAIFLASDNSDSLELVDLLLDRGADINTIGIYHETLLIRSAKYTQTSGEYIQGLIDRGAEVNYRDPNGKTPLIWSILSRNPEAVRVLLDNGADINEGYSGSRDRTALSIVNRPIYITRKVTKSKQIRKMILEASNPDRIRLNKFTVKELKALAKARGLKGYSRLNKEGLIDLLSYPR